MSKKKTSQPVEKTQDNKPEVVTVQTNNNNGRGKRYTQAKSSVDSYLYKKSQKTASTQEAIELLKENSKTKFVETIELHINVNEVGLKGEVLLPHATGKKIRVAIANDSVIDNLEKNVIDFDILVSTPAMMPKLTKYAKILGPKGLMPNPKSGTVGANVEDLVQKFSGNTLRYKTEGKASIIHLIVGKVDFDTMALLENVNAVIKSIDKKNIKSVFLSATMSPSIELNI